MYHIEIIIKHFKLSLKCYVTAHYTRCCTAFTTPWLGFPCGSIQTAVLGLPTSYPKSATVLYFIGPTLSFLGILSMLEVSPPTVQLQEVFCSKQYTAIHKVDCNVNYKQISSIGQGGRVMCKWLCWPAATAIRSFLQLTEVSLWVDENSWMLWVWSSHLMHRAAHRTNFRHIVKFLAFPHWARSRL